MYHNIPSIIITCLETTVVFGTKTCDLEPINISALICSKSDNGGLLLSSCSVEAGRQGRKSTMLGEGGGLQIARLARKSCGQSICKHDRMHLYCKRTHLVVHHQLLFRLFFFAPSCVHQISQLRYDMLPCSVNQGHSCPCGHHCCG